jgi:hypothetical protein
MTTPTANDAVIANLDTWLQAALVNFWPQATIARRINFCLAFNLRCDLAFDPEPPAIDIQVVIIDKQRAISDFINYERLDNIEGMVTDLLSIETTKLSKQARRNFKKKNITLFQLVVAGPPYNGCCPNCGAPGVVTVDGNVTGHVDHWLGKNKRRAVQGWLICAPCNRSFGSNSFYDQCRDIETRRRFAAFQRVLAVRKSGSETTRVQVGNLLLSETQRSLPSRRALRETNMRP